MGGGEDGSAGGLAGAGGVAEAEHLDLERDPEPRHREPGGRGDLAS